MSVANATTASASGAVAIGANTTQASRDNSLAVGSDAKATANNSVAVGSNSVADRTNSVAVGHAGNERQITHVAAGSQATDAVNVDQLSRSVATATGNANAHTEQRFGELRRDLKQQDSALSAGIAGAMAMASLPRSTSAGGSMTSVAMGNYRGQSALAIGVSHVSDNGRWSTNLMGTTSSQKDTGVAVGVGYQW